MSCTDVQTIQPGDGSKVNFSFDFPYILKSEIHVYFWNATTKEWDEKLTTDGTYPWQVTDANPTIVEFTGDPPPEPTAPTDPGEPTVDNVRIRRITNIDDIRALFNPGSAIRSDDLNKNFEQLRYAIQEANCVGIPDDVDEYLKTYYWNKFDDVIYSADAWPTDGTADQRIATVAAMDARFQDEATETVVSGAWVSDDDHIATTQAIDERFFDNVDETIESGDVWTNSNGLIATTSAIDARIDAAITGDITSDGSGITVTDDGDGTITLSIEDEDLGLEKIDPADIINRAGQDAAEAPADTKLFTSLAAARRFDTLVQTADPGNVIPWETGKGWLQNDTDLTLSIWTGSGWTPVASGGSFTSQTKVVYVDAENGNDAKDGHRISTPKDTIKSAVNQINTDLFTSITNGGSSYVDGTYTNVTLTGGSGVGLQADLVVAGGVVTTVTLKNNRTLANVWDYQAGDVLSANNADLGGSGAGLSITLSTSDGSVVIVAAGVYQEIAPIQIRRKNISIVGQSLRSCIVHPTVATQGDQSAGNHALFELNSGSYIQNLTLTGMKANNAGSNVLDADLPANQGWNFAFLSGATLYKSPYIQNCTNFSDSEIDNSALNAEQPAGGLAGDLDSAPTGGGMLVDGSVLDVASPLRSMVADSYTHVGLNGPGILVTNNGYTQITSSYAFFNKYHIKALNGGQANLAASTTDFGDRALVADGKSTAAIFTSNVDGAASDGDISFNINEPTAGAGWFGDTERPGTNMLVEVNSVIYPILSAVANVDSEGGAGWTVTISRPNADNRSQNDGLNGAVNDDAAVSFYLRSMIASSGHTMEYVGSGTDYRALPENGGVPNDTKQKTELNNGKIWTATTDHNGKFTIGGNQAEDPFFEVDQQLGFVTIPEGSIAFNLLSDLTPQLGGDLDANNNTITGLPDAPSNDNEAASKKYVDDQNSTQDTAISSNASSISTNATNIASNTSSITTNATNIASNTSNITTNTNDIASNTTAIAARMPLAGGTFTGDVTFQVSEELRFFEAVPAQGGNTSVQNYVGLKGPVTLDLDNGSEVNYVLTLPTSYPDVAGKAIISDLNGNLSWGFAGGAMGGGNDQIFFENDQTVTTDYEISANKNAMSAGPITINSNVVVTVPSGSTWVIV